VVGEVTLRRRAIAKDCQWQMTRIDHENQAGKSGQQNQPQTGRQSVQQQRQGGGQQGSGQTGSHHGGQQGTTKPGAGSDNNDQNKR
jgi:hypothetical protein